MNGDKAEETLRIEPSALKECLMLRIYNYVVTPFPDSGDSSDNADYS